MLNLRRALVACAIGGAAGCGDRLADEGPEGAPVATQAMRHAADPCPPPFVREGRSRVCMLTGDAQLEGAVVIQGESHLTLDCRGHALLPAVPAGDSAESSPPRAIVAAHTDRLAIRHCQVGWDGDESIGEQDQRFTYGVSVLMSERADIQDNQIHAWRIAVQGLKLNDSRISGNTLTFRSNENAGLSLGISSSRNRIVDNLVVEAGAADAGTLNGGGNCILIYQNGLGELETVSSGNTLIQVPVLSRGTGGSWHYEVGMDNLVEGNAIHRETPPPATARGSGIEVAQGTWSTRIIGNAITGTSNGIDLAGEPAGRLVRAPGDCVADAERLCLTDAHCGSAGPCQGVGTPQLIPGTQGNNRIEDNVLAGPYYANRGPRSGIAIFVSPSQDNAIVAGNRIGLHGSSQDFTGILLMGKALETVRVERNVITGTTTGIRFAQVGMRRFDFIGARITLNDLVGNGINVSVDVGLSMTAPFGAAVEMSDDGRGNHYGHPCGADGAFIEAGQPNADSGSALLVDSHPFGVPVAETPDAFLPETCSR